MDTNEIMICVYGCSKKFSHLEVWMYKLQIEIYWTDWTVKCNVIENTFAFLEAKLCSSWFEIAVISLCRFPLWNMFFSFFRSHLKLRFIVTRRCFSNIQIKRKLDWKCNANGLILIVFHLYADAIRISKITVNGNSARGSDRFHGKVAFIFEYLRGNFFGCQICGDGCPYKILNHLKLYELITR